MSVFFWGGLGRSQPRLPAIFGDFSADATGRGLENEPKSLADQVKRRGAAVRPAGSWRSGRVSVAAQCNPFRRSAGFATTFWSEEGLPKG